MKKRKVLGAIAGVMAIAIAAGATYAWFTSTADPVVLNVDTAKIEFAAVGTSYAENKLPGETVEVADWMKDTETLTGTLKFTSNIAEFFTNNSTRGSVVEFSIDKDSLMVQVPDGTSINPDGTSVTNYKNIDQYYPTTEGQDHARDVLAELKKAGNVWIQCPSGGKVLNYNDKVYVWLDRFEQLNDVVDEFSVQLIVPTNLGGNVEGDENYGDEHQSKITVNCKAYAVQGTYAALADVFDGNAGGDVINNHVANAFKALADAEVGN